MMEPDALISALRQSAAPEAVDAIVQLIVNAPDCALSRINALAFAAEHGLNEESAIAAFLHAARLGLFELSWNVLCPGCGGVLDQGATLKTLNQDQYACALCSARYEPTLDEMVEVTFTVRERIRKIVAHEPDKLSPIEYYRQIFFSSGVDLPDNYEEIFGELVLEALELPPAERAILSLPLPSEFIVLFDPVTHAVQFIDVQGEPTRERQNLTFVLNEAHTLNDTAILHPGALRLTIENRTHRRALPSVWRVNDMLYDLLGRRRPFLTAKRLISNQTFRDIYRTDTLDVDQRLKITSLTFLFTDLKGSTELYERVGDLVAYDLVRAHFQVLTDIVASEAGAVVKTIGDAVMATFPTPDRAIAAALKMSDAMHRLNEERGREDLLLKIGLHEGPCLAVTLNDRQDYFGQTVNIASRVQHLAISNAVFATEAVVDHPEALRLIKDRGLEQKPQQTALRGITDAMTVYKIA